MAKQKQKQTDDSSSSSSSSDESVSNNNEKIKEDEPGKGGDVEMADPVKDKKDSRSDDDSDSSDDDAETKAKAKANTDADADADTNTNTNEQEEKDSSNFEEEIDDGDDGAEEGMDPEEVERLGSTGALSKSWSIASSHVPTFTGGTVTAGRTHNWLLLPVHGDLAMVDATLGVKKTTVRTPDEMEDLGGEEDDGQGMDHESITAYALDRNDQILMTCTRNLLLHHYTVDGETGIPKRTKTWGRSGHTLPVTHMAFHPSSVFLATGSVDGTVRIWDVRGAFVTHVLKPVAGGEGGGSGRLSITGLVWRQELGQLVLAIARDDGSIVIQDLRDAANDHIVILRDHLSPVTSMEWWHSTDDESQQFFVSTGRDAILNLWRMVPIVVDDKNTKKQRKKKKHGADTTSVAAATATTIAANALANIPQFQYRRIQSIPLYEQVEGMAVFRSSKHPKELRVYTAGSKGVVRLWKATVVAGQTPQMELALEQASSEAYGEARGGYMGLILNHSAMTDKDKTEQLIAVDAEHNLSFLSSNKLVVHRTIVGNNDEILDLKVIPTSAAATALDEGKTSSSSTSTSNSMVVATNSPQIRIFDLANFSCHVLDGHTSTVLCVDASPCGRYVASCGKDKTMRLWRVADRRCVGIATGHMEPIGACGLSRKVGRYEVGGKAAKNGGGAFCVTASMDRTLKRWNLPGLDDLSKTSDPIDMVAATSIRGHEKDINIVSIAPNDSLVASGSQDKMVKLWNATDLTLRATLKGHRRGVWDCQFSPIDRVLATSSGDKTIKLWSLGDFSCVRTFQGHVSSALRVRFLHTGLQLISAGADGLIKLWTIRTNECEATLDAHDNKVWALDMHPDGKSIVSGGADSKLAIWKDNTQQMEEEERAVEAETIQLEQKLANHLRHKEYGKALAIALQVDKPLQALRVINSIIEEEIDEGRGNGLEALQLHAKKWSDERLAQVLKYCRDWNTRSRNSHVAMLVVQAIVTTISVGVLSSTPGVPEIMAGITPYAERHFARLDRLHTNAYILDFTLSSMGSLDPALDIETEKDFAAWEKSSKLVLPPKFVDGRIQVGGKTVVGKAKSCGLADSDKNMDEDDEVRTIGDSSSDDDSSAGGRDEDAMDASSDSGSS